MKTIKLTWTGIRPLIMSNPQTVAITNPYTKEARRLNTLLKKQRKADSDKLMEETEEAQRRNDFKSSAYFDSEGFYLPDTVIIACLKESAKALRKGKDIDRAVMVSDLKARIECKRYKTLDAAFEDEDFRLEGPCRIPPKTGALIWKCRCQIPTGWKLSFSLEFEESMIAKGDLEDISDSAGKMVGIGGWRPRFGRFTSEME